LDVDQLYIDDPPVHTSGGIFAATDLGPHRSGGQAQFIKDSMRLSDTSEMEPILERIRENLGGPSTLGRIAAQAHLASGRWYGSSALRRVPAFWDG
jgi:transcriptional regulator GlxA family with amidase domain